MTSKRTAASKRALPPRAADYAKSFLTEVGKAAKLAGGGYPNRYTAKAADVLPLIEGRGIQPAKDGVWTFGIDEGGEYAQPPGWMGKVEVHADRVAACPADQVLTIEAWDQSLMLLETATS